MRLNLIQALWSQLDSEYMNKELELLYFSSRPKTYSALQAVVVSAAKANSSLGKRGLFGGDKHLPAYNKFKTKLEKLCRAIDTDGYVMPVNVDDSWRVFEEDGNYLKFIDNLINLFGKVYPNWSDAYKYWEEFYLRAKNQGAKGY